MRTVPDRKFLAEISRQYKGSYCGKWIAAAHKFERAHNYLEAARSYSAARDSFRRRSAGWQCLEEWRAATGEHALRLYPALGLALMSPPFYLQFGVPRIRVPVPVVDGVAIEPEGGWKDVGMLEYLRYFLLNHESMAGDYERLASRLACQIGSREGRYGDVDLGDFYFGLARQYGGHHWETLAELAYAYLAALDYDNALREFLLLRKWQLRAHAFDASIWLEICHLQYYLGQNAKGDWMVRDYIAQCREKPAKEQRSLLRFAYSWAGKHHPQPAMVAALDRQKVKH